MKRMDRMVPMMKKGREMYKPGGERSSKKNKDSMTGLKAMFRSLSAEDRKKVMEAKHGIAGTPKMLPQMEYGDMSLPMQARMRMGREVPMTSAAYGKIEKAMYGKSSMKKKARYGQSMQTPIKK